METKQTNINVGCVQQVAVLSALTTELTSLASYVLFRSFPADFTCGFGTVCRLLRAADIHVVESCLRGVCMNVCLLLEVSVCVCMHVHACIRVCV